MYMYRPSYLNYTFWIQNMAGICLSFVSGYVCFTISHFTTYRKFVFEDNGAKRDWSRLLSFANFVTVAVIVLLLFSAIYSGVNLDFMRDCSNISKSQCESSTSEFWNSNILKDYKDVNNRFCKSEW